MKAAAWAGESGAERLLLEPVGTGAADPAVSGETDSRACRGGAEARAAGLRRAAGGPHPLQAGRGAACAGH